MIDFVDEARIWIKAGDGGSGCIAFRREKFVPKGGPSGGDGGKGGSVYFRACNNVKTLREYYYHRHFKAESGKPGEGNNRTGADGKDMILKVPPGTVVIEIREGEKEVILADLDRDGAQVLAAKGGKGGKGNASFKSSTNQTPRIATPGEPGEEKFIKLELKLIAEVGIIGYPNAGKSTLLSKISNARPKIAEYPFTTLNPNLGVVVVDNERQFVAADIPGLIEGASSGAGLGLKFLRHIERTKVLVHLIDLSLPDVAKRYHNIRNEIGCYDVTLLEKPEIVVGTKIDLPVSHNNIRELEKITGRYFLISSVTNEGINTLLEEIWRVLTRES
ncbi:MAG TPA: GTPase ObgE [bacterium]|nr:GTPase ObgE [bacterium]HOL34871.1 GTPase ObgE [bacterium]HPP07797.1 GTPase ObgE [bacterium]